MSEQTQTITICENGISIGEIILTANSLRALAEMLEKRYADLDSIECPTDEVSITLFRYALQKIREKEAGKIE